MEVKYSGPANKQICKCEDNGKHKYSLKCTATISKAYDLCYECYHGGHKKHETHN